MLLSFITVLFFWRTVFSWEEDRDSQSGQGGQTSRPRTGVCAICGEEVGDWIGVSPSKHLLDKVLQLLWPSLCFSLWFYRLENLTAVLPLRHESQRQ